MTYLLENVHEGMEPPPGADCVAYVKGKYDYYHYGCDGVDDRGWGCGYRTLQTLCSWVVHQRCQAGQEPARAVPSISEIQAALVSLGDKEPGFQGSRDWIGSTEVFLCLDHFYQGETRTHHPRASWACAAHPRGSPSCWCWTPTGTETTPSRARLPTAPCCGSTTGSGGAPWTPSWTAPSTTSACPCCGGCPTRLPTLESCNTSDREPMGAILYGDTKAPSSPLRTS
ncbi:UFM1 specific peptidase 1 isoform X4 [Haemaphysalis longicornis]